MLIHMSLHSFTLSFELTAVIDLEMDYPPTELCVTLQNDENAGTESAAQLNSRDLHLFL